MRRIAAAIVLVGFAFAFFTLPFAGVDILIDAVGFLLVWNGVRALQKKDAVYRFAAPCSLVLVAIAAAQVFLGGGVAAYAVQSGLAGWVLQGLRLAAEGLLYWQLLAGFARLAKAGQRPGLAKLAYVALAVCLAGVLVSACAWALLFFGYPLVVPVAAVVWAGHIALLAVLAGFVFWFGTQPE
ncbi:hypothetical protein LJC61_03635 [Ruminococcaceae bacterium OttesenSCG-928-A16]|nr:hypothetical protein [Ruminococcaceae bacterium OttesenSCG-928-A16]